MATPPAVFNASAIVYFLEFFALVTACAAVAAPAILNPLVAGLGVVCLFGIVHDAAATAKAPAVRRAAATVFSLSRFTCFLPFAAAVVAIAAAANISFRWLLIGFVGVHDAAATATAPAVRSAAAIVFSLSRFLCIFPLAAAVVAIAAAAMVSLRWLLIGFEGVHDPAAMATAPAISKAEAIVFVLFAFLRRNRLPFATVVVVREVA